MLSKNSLSLSRRQYLSGTAALLFGGVVGGASALYTPEKSPPQSTTIIGHRGAAGLAPPNTMAAIRQAIKHDVDGVELDVRQTLDGKLVLFHDPVLNWSTDGHGRISTSSWEQIENITVEGEEPLLTLEEALEMLADTNLELYLEMKRAGYTLDAVELVEQYGLQDRLTITSFEPVTLTAAQDQNIPTNLTGMTPNPELISDAVESGASSVASHYVPRALPWFVKEAHEAGLESGVWHLVETEQSLQNAFEANPDYIVTNRPDMARTISMS